MGNERITRRKLMQDGAVAAAGVSIALNAAKAAPSTQPAGAESKILNRSENMEYRRLGKTGLMISAVSMGGHWKQIPYKFGSDEFKKNRHDVLSACIDAGLNYVDACTGEEVVAYAEALRGRRGQMYLGYSWYEHEMRFKEWQSEKKLLEGFDAGLREAKLDHVDLWRVTCYWQPNTNHSVEDEQAIVGALDQARKAGKARFCGISTHKHDWAIRMMETYPDCIQVIVVPYTAGSKKAHQRVEPADGDWKAAPDEAVPQDKSTLSLIDAVKKNNVGWFGIKPFASGSVFRSRGVPESGTKNDDDERARLTLRHILANEALTAPIPGLITADQVRNAAKAVTERRRLDRTEARRLEQTVGEMWANLPEDYQWLKEWEWV